MLHQWLRRNRGFLAFLLVFGLFRTAVADWNPVPSGSMRPTIQEGDVVFVNRLAFDLKLPLTNVIVAHTGEPCRGDIVTFFSPEDGTRLIKRLVAGPGDRVEMRDKVVIVNGQPASYQALELVDERASGGRVARALHLRENTGAESHVVQWLRPAGAEHDSFAPMVIPPDHYLMLGDNRDNSADSRWFGLVPRELLIGRARNILVSANIQSNWAPRFERFGKRLD